MRPRLFHNNFFSDPFCCGAINILMDVMGRLYKYAASIQAEQISNVFQWKYNFLIYKNLDFIRARRRMK